MGIASKYSVAHPGCYPDTVSWFFSIPEFNNKIEEMGEKKFVVLPDDNDIFRLSLFVHLLFCPRYPTRGHKLFLGVWRLTPSPPGGVHIGGRALYVLNLIWFGCIARLSQFGGGG